MQKTNRLKTAIFRKVRLQRWPMAGVWELGCWKGSHHSQIRMAHCPKIANNVVYATHLFFFYRSLKILLCARQKPLGTESRVPSVVYISHVSCLIPLGDHPWKLACASVTLIFPLCPPHFFPVLTYLALYPFIVINHNHECDSMLSPSESLQLGGQSWGPPTDSF